MKWERLKERLPWVRQRKVIDDLRDALRKRDEQLQALRNGVRFAQHDARVMLEALTRALGDP